MPRVVAAAKLRGEKFFFRKRSFAPQNAGEMFLRNRLLFFANPRIGFRQTTLPFSLSLSLSLSHFLILPPSLPPDVVLEPGSEGVQVFLATNLKKQKTGDFFFSSSSSSSRLSSPSSSSVSLTTATKKRELVAAAAAATEATGIAGKKIRNKIFQSIVSRPRTQSGKKNDSRTFFLFLPFFGRNQVPEEKFEGSRKKVFLFFARLQVFAENRSCCKKIDIKNRIATIAFEWRSEKKLRKKLFD